MKFPGVISLRKLLPICPMPNGGLRRADDITLAKLMKMPCAVSGRRYASPDSSSTGAEVGAQQPVELLRLGPGAAGSAIGAGDFRERLALLLFEMVGPEPLVARLALDQRIDESLDVAGGFPHLAREDDAGIEADDVVAALHHGAPPFALDVVLQLDTERPVVPGSA